LFCDERTIHFVIIKTSYELYHVLMLRTLPKNNYFFAYKKGSVAGQKLSGSGENRLLKLVAYAPIGGPMLILKRSRSD